MSFRNTRKVLILAGDEFPLKVYYIEQKFQNRNEVKEEV